MKDVKTWINEKPIKEKKVLHSRSVSKVSNDKKPDKLIQSQSLKMLSTFNRKSLNIGASSKVKVSFEHVRGSLVLKKSHEVVKKVKPKSNLN